ncbi:MAG: SCO family protein [Acidobacteriota bacterium]
MMFSPPSGSSRQRLAVWLLALASTLSLVACKPAPREGEGATSAPAASAHFNAVDITGADYARQFSLKDVNGQVRTLAEFKGKVVFLFFGYTQCPDVCPTTMADLSAVRKKLGPDGQRVQGIFVTVDPQRDTPEVLKPYLAAMDPSFVGLRGTPTETEATAKEFKVFFQKVEGRDEGYTIDHTAGAFIFDPEGHVRLFVRYGLGVDAIAADIKALLATSAPR